eukprot:TRINITY_DN6104_c0_g1_i1.p1 TRINITY_DN6104_c0_g1~~TRINITY_DN6104_c0_g1_i1.p1  ORF type:complete len:163 (-),score=48.32 TRINITY_DN6104_c0_g1_i1:19-507(-)
MLKKEPEESGDWKSELKKKNKACLIAVKNRTNRKFVKVGTNIVHGKVRKEPSDTIEPLSFCEFAVEGRSPLTGTQGSVQYEISGTNVTFLLYWYNPKVGKPKLGFAINPPFTCTKDGHFDKLSEISFEISEEVSSSPSSSSPVLCVDTVSYTHLTLPTICSV